MSFTRSASGPAGLSINTGAANTFGNNSSQPPAPSGLFGSGANTMTQPSTTGLFGSTAMAAQPAQTNSLFGNTANATQQQQQQQQQQPQQAAGGLFGSNMATNKPGGLFGGATTATSGGGGGLFGSAANTTSQPAQTGMSLFGSTTAQQPASGFTGGGLFGQAKPATSSFFGNNTAGSSGSTGGGLAGGLFGQSAAAAAPTNSLFASTAQQPAVPALGSTMGPQVVPGVRIDLSNLRNTTRFNDLQEDLQKEIAAMDALVQRCIGEKDQLDAFIPQHAKQLESIPQDAEFVSRKYTAVDSALETDLQTIKQLRDQVKDDYGEIKLSVNAVNNLALPSQYHLSPDFFGSTTRAQHQQSSASGGAGAGDDNSQATSEDMVNYFLRATDEMDEQVKKLQRTVKEIDMHLGGVEQNILEQASRLQLSNGTLGGGQDDRMMELYHVLRDFEEGIVQVATVVGSAREGVTELQMNEFRGRGLLSS